MNFIYEIQQQQKQNNASATRRTTHRRTHSIRQNLHGIEQDIMTCSLMKTKHTTRKRQQKTENQNLYIYFLFRYYFHYYFACSISHFGVRCRWILHISMYYILHKVRSIRSADNSIFIINFSSEFHEYNSSECVPCKTISPQKFSVQYILLDGCARACVCVCATYLKSLYDNTANEIMQEKR